MAIMKKAPIYSPCDYDLLTQEQVVTRVAEGQVLIHNRNLELKSDVLGL